MAFISACVIDSIRDSRLPSVTMLPTARSVSFASSCKRPAHSSVRAALSEPFCIASNALSLTSPSQRFSPLAGFLEAGESIEEAVHREVMEEVGLRVHNLQYFMSQSWPFPHSLMIAFTADYLDGEIRLDENEIAEARWFGPGDAWPEASSSVSISALLVRAHRPPAVA